MIYILYQQLESDQADPIHHVMLKHIRADSNEQLESAVHLKPIMYH